jgi:uncharacterized Zn finger protein
MKNSLKFVIEEIQKKLNRTDLIDIVEYITKNSEEYYILKVKENLSYYLSCDLEDLEDAYNQLRDAQDSGNGDDNANKYVSVWEPLEHFTVDDILELVE